MEFKYDKIFSLSQSQFNNITESKSDNVLTNLKKVVNITEYYSLNKYLAMM